MPIPPFFGALILVDVDFAPNKEANTITHEPDYTGVRINALTDSAEEKANLPCHGLAVEMQPWKNPNPPRLWR